MNKLLLLKNWNGIAKGQIIEGGPKRTKRLVKARIARVLPEAVKPESIPNFATVETKTLTTKEASTKKSDK